jgi:hypothetical protein
MLEKFTKKTVDRIFRKESKPNVVNKPKPAPQHPIERAEKSNVELPIEVKKEYPYNNLGNLMLRRLILVICNEFNDIVYQ